jgi:recombination protein RecT
MSEETALKPYQAPASLREATARLPTTVAPLLPRGMDPKQFTGLVISVLAKWRPEDRRAISTTAGLESFVFAVRELAELGLYPGTSAAAPAYLIPKGGKCQPRVGYRGLEELAYRKGWLLYGDAVNKGDIFEYELGTNPSLVHKPRRAQPEGGAEVTHAYAICKDMKTGVLLRVMVLDRTEIERRRHLGDGAQQAWWKNHYAVMAAKSAVRALGMRMPLAPDGRSLTDRGVVVDLDEEVSARQQMPDVPPPTALPPEQEGDDERESDDGASEQGEQGRLV